MKIIEAKPSVLTGKDSDKTPVNESKPLPMRMKAIFFKLWRRLILLVLITGFASCGFFRAPGKDSCDKILSREKMTEILTDVYLLEALLREYRQETEAADDSAAVFYRTLFLNHDVDPELFQQALDCYLLDKREMELIHEQILSDLSVREGEAESLLKELER